MKNAFVQELINMQKAGIKVHLTDAGVAKIIEMLKGDIEEYVRGDAEAV